MPSVVVAERCIGDFLFAENLSKIPVFSSFGGMLRGAKCNTEGFLFAENFSTVRVQLFWASPRPRSLLYSCCQQVAVQPYVRMLTENLSNSV